MKKPKLNFTQNQVKQVECIAQTVAATRKLSTDRLFLYEKWINKQNKLPSRSNGPNSDHSTFIWSCQAFQGNTVLMHVVWIRSTYWQVLWQPAEWTQSCIDVWAAQLRQQTGGPDGLWWPSCRLNTPRGETQAFILSLLPCANNLRSYHWQRGGKGVSLCSCSIGR